MLHVVKIFDAIANGPSVLDHLFLSSQEEGGHLVYSIYIGSHQYAEYTEQEIDGEVHIYIPFPFAVKHLANISEPVLKKYAMRVTDILEHRFARFAGESNLLFHFENCNWGYVAQGVKAALKATVTCSYNGAIGAGSAMQLAMVHSADSILCTSQNARKQLLAACPEIIEKVNVIYNVVSPAGKTVLLPEQSDILRSNWGLLTAESVFVFDKRMAGAQYDIPYLIQAFTSLKQTAPGARLFILHEPDIMAYASLIEKRMWSSITFINGLTASEIMELYMVANAVIIPAFTEHNFLYILPLLQQGIHFIYDKDPSENRWFNELVNMEVVKPTAAGDGDTRYLLQQLRGRLIHSNSTSVQELPAVFAPAFIRKQLIAVYVDILSDEVTG